MPTSICRKKLNIDWRHKNAILCHFPWSILPDQFHIITFAVDSRDNDISIKPIFPIVSNQQVNLSFLLYHRPHNFPAAFVCGELAMISELLLLWPFVVLIADLIRDQRKIFSGGLNCVYSLSSMMIAYIIVAAMLVLIGKYYKINVLL